MTNNECKEWFDSLPLVNFLFIGRGKYEIEDYDYETRKWYTKKIIPGIAPYFGYNTCLVSRLSYKSFEQLNEFASCRSWTTDIYQSVLLKHDMNEYQYGKMKTPSWKYLFQAMSVSDSIPKECYRALRLGLAFVHAFEKMFGVPQTQCWRASVPNKMDKTKDIGILIVRAHQMFVTNPYVTSLYQIMWRIAYYFAARDLADKFILESGEFMQDWRRIIRVAYRNKDDLDRRDNRYLSAIYSKRTLLKRLIEKFFPHTVIYKAYAKGKDNPWNDDVMPYNIHSTAGIGNLCTATTFDEELNEELEKFYRQYNTELFIEGVGQYEFI